MDNQIRVLPPTIIKVSPPKPGQAGSDQSRYGSVKMAYIPRFIGAGIILTCLFTYFMAMYKKEEKPFPYCTITMTAEHFPQSVVFRLNMLFISGVTVLLWFTIYHWLSFISRKYDCGKISINVFYACIIGNIFFALAIATIDTGKMNVTLHTLCAIAFFLIWVGCIVIITYKIYEFKTIFRTIVSPLSLTLKVGTAVAMVLTLVINLLNELKPEMLGIDIHIDIIEWYVTFEMAIWIFSFSLDWEVFYFTLDGDKIALAELDVFQKRHEEYASYHKQVDQPIDYQTIQYV